jgi:hypothetical protein
MIKYDDELLFSLLGGCLQNAIAMQNACRNLPFGLQKKQSENKRINNHEWH